MGGLSFDLLEQLTFYGAYHANKWNQLIHFVCVPAILWSAAVWLAASGPLGALPAALGAALPPSAVPNAAGGVLACYCLYYLCLEPVAGASWAAFVAAPMWLSATWFQAGVAGAWRWALGVHVLGWYLQIHPGHAILEGRKPALLDSLVQALTLAPLFVWFELLFLLGYRPQLYAQLQAAVGRQLAAFKSAQAGKVD